MCDQIHISYILGVKETLTPTNVFLIEFFSMSTVVCIGAMFQSKQLN